MAEYKVPQDVEAEDKLLGPFSFRQFIYLGVAAGMGFLVWALWQVFPPLILLPLPVMVAFLALALPLRKDQPMEIYLAALVSFFLKPRRRLWDADGIESLIEITAPKEIDQPQTKGLSQNEAQQRLSYLAQLVDTQGWAVRGVDAPPAAAAMQNDAILEAQSAEDVLDESSGVGRNFDTMIDQANQRHKQALIQQFKDRSVPVAADQPPAPTAADTTLPSQVTFSPYPTSMHQSVIQPVGSKPAKQPEPVAPAPSENTVSPDIMNLAYNPDLSVETIAHEAKRKNEQKASGNDEIVLRLH